MRRHCVARARVSSWSVARHMCILRIRHAHGMSGLQPWCSTKAAMKIQHTCVPTRPHALQYSCGGDVGSAAGMWFDHEFEGWAHRILRVITAEWHADW